MTALSALKLNGYIDSGTIHCYGRGEKGSIVKMLVGCAIPGFLGQLLDNLFIDRVVESTLNADLERFRQYALQAKANQ